LINKILAITAAVLLTSSFDAHSQVRVTGVGQTYDEAKNDGFRKAIEQHSGTAVVSDMRIRGDRISSHNILTYSAGYVKDFRVLSRHDNAGTVTLTMDVTPDTSLIPGSVINSNTGKELNGNKVDTALQTYTSSKRDGQKFILEVMGGWPERALSTNTLNWRTGFDGQQYIDVTFRVNYNRRWTAALEEAIYTTAISPKNGDLQAIAMFTDQSVQRPDMTWRAYGWPNYSNLGAVRHHLTVNQPLVRVAFNGGSIVACVPLDVRTMLGDGHHSGISATKFYLGATLVHTERIYLKPGDLRGVNSIDTSVVKKCSCNF
jgi:hypothetical protein